MKKQGMNVHTMTQLALLIALELVMARFEDLKAQIGR